MENANKIYTKTGDKGSTSLIGGSRVPKYDERVEAYGTVDELNSWIGLIRDQEMNDDVIALLIEIQNCLFILESQLARDPEAAKIKLPEIRTNDIERLEHEIDRMEESLTPLGSFILPGGNITASYCHIARTVCRRAERLSIKVAEKYHVDPLNIGYLNRLSDYLFVLSRKLLQDANGEEILWKARQ